MSQNVMVEIQNLTKVFSEIIAVNDISLKINQGEFVSILGPSGCGKTTLLRMIRGLEHPTKGNIYLQGKLINNIKAYRRPINMVFQRYALFPHLNVYENIAFGPKISRMKKHEIGKKVKKMLELVQLEGFENRMSNELSGGQCQRVALARALINEPLVLLLDEPLGALDLKLRKAMQTELRNIQRKLGVTFIYVTHDQEEALVLSDSIMVMNEGKVIQTGSPMEIYKNPNSIFSSKFIGESNLIKGIIESKSQSEDKMVIKASDKRIISYFRDDVEAGRNVYLSIRFESIGTSKSEKKELDNNFSGTVKNFIFLGPIVKYDIEVPGLKDMLSAITHIGNVQDEYFKIGDKVNLNWSKYSCTLLFE